MKKLMITCFLISALQQLNAQNILPHQSEGPPANPNGGFIRGLVVDCVDRIVDDMFNNHSAGLELRMIAFLRANFISYTAFDGLENIIGDPAKEYVLHQLLRDVHTNIPGIEIAAMGNSTAVFSSRFFRRRNLSIPDCTGDIMRVSEQSELNDQSVAVINLFTDVFKAEQQSASQDEICLYGFDALYLHYPYWTTSGTLMDIRSNFENFISLLTLMNGIKCMNPCIKSVDASFFPVYQFANQGWTATDQITAMDELTDRVVLNGFTNDAVRIYHENCYTYHLFTDQFSKKHSKLFIGMHAGSSRFTNCSGGTANAFLGDYLDYTGNMYSLEKMLMNDLTDPFYFCNYCSCMVNGNNQFSASNSYGNEFMGTMWFSYSFMEQHQLYRIEEEIPKRFIPDILGRQY